MLFRCRVCEEKDKRIEDLLDQIKMLRPMVYTGVTQAQASFEAREIDQLLSGSDDTINIISKENSEEISSLLSGSYDLSQVEVI